MCDGHPCDCVLEIKLLLIMSMANGNVVGNFIRCSVDVCAKHASKLGARSDTHPMSITCTTKSAIAFWEITPSRVVPFETSRTSSYGYKVQCEFMFMCVGAHEKHKCVFPSKLKLENKGSEDVILSLKVSLEEGGSSILAFGLHTSK